jgi:hypothetical protein
MNINAELCLGNAFVRNETTQRKPKYEAVQTSHSFACHNRNFDSQTSFPQLVIDMSEYIYSRHFHLMCRFSLFPDHDDHLINHYSSIECRQFKTRIKIRHFQHFYHDRIPGWCENDFLNIGKDPARPGSHRNMGISPHCWRFERTFLNGFLEEGIFFERSRDHSTSKRNIHMFPSIGTIKPDASHSQCLAPSLSEQIHICTGKNSCGGQNDSAFGAYA